MITFNVGGKVMTEAEFKAQAGRAPPKPAAEPEPFFKGFKVLGHPPGHIEACKRLQNTEHQRWLMMSAEDMKQHKKEGRKDPGQFELDSWLRKHRGQRIERLYELRSAAEECAELARKAGWEHVRIEAWERE